MPAESRTHGALADAPLALRLASASAALDAGALPSAVLAKAKLCVLDWLSCALAARDLPWSRQALACATPVVNGAAIVGLPGGYAPHDAAFANAALGHGLVRDDMHVGSVSHLGTVIVPALLALCARTDRQVTGRDWIAALAAGYEIGGKLGRMILDGDVARIFRPTGITGPIAAAAAGARLVGLDAARTSTALAIAANTAAGYNEWAATGGSEMFFHVGFAARNAVTAVALAADGAYASPTALDGPAGLLAAFRKPRSPAVPAPFADGFEIERVFFKPVPACNYAQSPAQAALAIARRRRIAARDVERVVVRVTRAAAEYPGCDARGPFAHVLQAKMSIQYNVAAALVHADFAERNYEPRANPDVDAVAQVTTLEADAALSAAYPERQGAEVIVTLRGSGEELRERVPDVTAADGAVVRERFALAARGVLGADGAAALLLAVDTLENAADGAQLPHLVRAP